MVLPKLLLVLSYSRLVCNDLIEGQMRDGSAKKNFFKKISHQKSVSKKIDADLPYYEHPSLKSPAQMYTLFTFKIYPAYENLSPIRLT